MKKHANKTKTYAQVLKLSNNQQIDKSNHVNNNSSDKNEEQSSKKQKTKTKENDKLKKIIESMEHQIHQLKLIAKQLCESVPIDDRKKSEIQSSIEKMQLNEVDGKEHSPPQQVEPQEEKQEHNNKRKDHKKTLQEIGNSGPLLPCAVTHKRVKINEENNQTHIL